MADGVSLNSTRTISKLSSEVPLGLFIIPLISKNPPKQQLCRSLLISHTHVESADGKR